MTWGWIAALDALVAVWTFSLVALFVRGFRDLRELIGVVRCLEQRSRGGYGGGERPLSEGEIEPPPVGPPHQG